MLRKPLLKPSILIAALALALPMLAACDDPGPAEEAGRTIDDAAEGAGEAMEEAGEEIEDAAD
jgi:predicted small secreted protein